MWTSANTWKVFVLAVMAVLLGTSAFAQELELSDLIEEALKNNPDILASRTKIEAAKHRIPQSKSLPDPMFMFGYQNEGISQIHHLIFTSPSRVTCG